MIKVVIFDADGMTLKSPLFSTRLAKKYNISHKKILPFFQKEFNDCLIGKANLKKEVKKYFAKWGWRKSVDVLLDYWFIGENEINQQIIRSIKELREKGVKCLLATNQEKHRTDYIINNLGFKKIFNEIFSSSFVGYKKPQKEFFDYIIRKLSNIKKKEILFWDDREKNVAAAMKFGFKAEIYKNFADFKKKIYQYLKLVQNEFC